MRTFKLVNAGETEVIEIETDSVSDTQDNMTIHDIFFIKGDKDTIVGNGFKFMIPNVITRAGLIQYAKDKDYNLFVIDTSKETSIQLNEL